MNTAEMIEALRFAGSPDCRDVVRVSGGARRSYWLNSDGRVVWGCDPDGADIDEIPVQDFISEWCDPNWSWEFEV